MSMRAWPGLVDLQVNGFRGLDVNADDVTIDTITALARELWTQGVTRFLPTVITASEEKILHALETIAAARRTDPLVAHSIAGIHVEGPSLSADEGARGAHDVTQLRDPSVDELERWQRAADGLIRIVTLAPERDGALEYITGATARGIRISLGHCSPSPERVREAVRTGATLSTHLGNGIPATLPRHPNAIWAQLASDSLTAMFIADGHHLPADALTAMIRAKGVPRSVLTSDSAALAGSAPGRYTTPVGGDVTVGHDGRLALTGTPLLAGSGASLLDCVAWTFAELRLPEVQVLAMASHNPARVLGIDLSNDHVDVEMTGTRPAIHRVVVAGTTVYEKEG